MANEILSIQGKGYILSVTRVCGGIPSQYSSSLACPGLNGTKSCICDKIMLEGQKNIFANFHISEKSTKRSGGAYNLTPRPEPDLSNNSKFSLKLYAPPLQQGVFSRDSSLI